MRSRCLVLTYSDGLSDPPTRQAATFFRDQGYDVRLVVSNSREGSLTGMHDGLWVQDARPNLRANLLGPVFRVIRWHHFVKHVREQIRNFKPDVVVTIMLHPLAALPSGKINESARHLACIYDIPATKYSGRFDRIIFRKAWKRLREADVVWASDPFKGELARGFAQLGRAPLICYNCPPRDYLPVEGTGRNRWLRAELRKQGATLGDDGGSILIRAGAVGEQGGIEQTLEAMQTLPDDFVFVMMGRPTSAYKARVAGMIDELGLKSRAFLWDRVSDVIWKRALLGADIGHLIHGPFESRKMLEQVRLNSSLSNNRLFQYMAAGLPILTYDDPRMQLIYDQVGCFEIARLRHLREDIGAHWRRLANDRVRRENMGLAACHAYLSTYNWEKQFAPIFAAVAG